jgi:flagellar hook-associated protein 1 FlgK
MSSISAALNSSAQALSAIETALDTVQNNVANANTAGYATQQVNFSALGFDVSEGLAGGVQASVTSTRDQYLEQSVRTETTALGFLEQQNASLANVQSAFSVSGDSGDAGVAGALASFASSFSTLSVSPDDSSAKANVIQAATTVAEAFNQTASQLSQVSTQAQQQASSLVGQINTLTTHIASLNGEIQNGGQNDAGLSADLNNSLDSLSQLLNVTVSYNSDGSASVLLDGQTPLVLGTQAEALSIKSQPIAPDAAYPNATPGIDLVGQDGMVLTSQATQGQLGAVLQIVNQTIPSYLGNSTEEGGLNQLAQTFADRVNAILTAGQVSAGPPPVNGSPLFTYDASTDTNAASSLAVSSTITPSQIATIDPGPPVVNNGVATELADIADPSNAADLIDGQSYTSFYGQLAAEAGNAASQASTGLQTQQDLTTQAQNQRQQVSGVDLDTQAAQLLSLQQAYQATARLITIINTIQQAAVNIIPET